jgi:hypothetical protein
MNEKVQKALDQLNAKAAEQPQAEVEGLGACAYNPPGGPATCIQTTRAQCDALEGVFFPGQPCD